MTPEQRLDRLERIAKLFVSAGLRARTNIRRNHEAIREHRESLREQDEKINILINMQIENEERFTKNEERFARNEERFARNEERFNGTAQAIDRLISSQSRIDEKLETLIDMLRRSDLGDSFA